MVGIVPNDTGDQAYDSMSLQRCLTALEAAAEGAEVVVLGASRDVAGILTPRPGGPVVLLASDTEPQPGFLSRLLAARMPVDGLARVYSPQVSGLLTWPPILRDWEPATTARFPRQAVLFDSGDWPRLAPVDPSDNDSLIGAVIDAADHHVIVDDSAVLSYRPDTLAHDMARSLPRFDIPRCGRAVVSAASTDFVIARAALRAWLELANCGIYEARESLLRWRAARSQMSAEARAGLPRWMTHCDQHAEAVIHESLLCPDAVSESRDAVVRDDFESARLTLKRHPDSYCAAVAVMALATEDSRRANAGPIPRVIVQGWFDSDLPADAQPLIDAWARLHPGWQHVLFDSDSAEQWLWRNVGPEYARTFRSAKPVAKSNLFRYAYLSAEGGVWSDIDDRPVASLDDLIEGAELVVLRESLGAIGDNIIAVIPGHPVLVAARDEAFRNERDGYTELQWLANGPGMFTRKVAGWIAEDAQDLPLGYFVVPGTRMMNYVSVHEDLAYKATALAWDADIHRLPEGSLFEGEAPEPKSARQRALLR